MSKLQIGIVGLPNVGKSTLFNALIRGAKAEAANYPFCTIDPNVGVVEVPDERLAPLAEVSKSKKIVPAVIEFVDIAGLVRGANKGEGLGNQFLAHIRECDAIAMVVRFFEDSNIVHVEGKVDPLSDIETIETELQLADFATVEKRLASVEKELKGPAGKEVKALQQTLLKIKPELENGKNVRDISFTEEEKGTLKGLSLLTLKPLIYIANVSEDVIAKLAGSEMKQSEYKEIAAASGLLPTGRHGAMTDEKSSSQQLEANSFIPISARVEEELNSLEDTEKAEYLESLGIEESGLNKLIKEAYKTLGLITYFTSGEPETRAWTIHNGFTAPQAAGVIHTDFERGFIAADIVPWDKLVEAGGWPEARAKGWVKMEGKTYIMKDGDTCLFKFNV